MVIKNNNVYIPVPFSLFLLLRVACTADKHCEGNGATVSTCRGTNSIGVVLLPSGERCK